ncbi:MAG: argininosuccinate synthase, partial [Acidimicrobiaceae bacterium]|nr:argininosuccinate synthase [Acidimicrobiaceae bacterium]
VAVRRLIEKQGVEEIALAAHVGQGGDWDAVNERALAAGAADAVVVDCREEFARDFCVPALQANALYEGKYPLVSALSRPVIVKHLVEAARQFGADAVAHGCTGKGNDQVRFEVSTRALAPDLEVLAPVRVWGMTREDAIEYAATHDIPITASKEKLYSIDDNLWGRAIECGEMEDPWAAPPQGVWSLTVPTQSDERELVIAFDQGVPVAVDGTELGLVEIVEEVGAVVGSYGWGRIDMVENRRVGIKSRETYECPASLALILAHADLESVTLERDLAREKQRLEIRYAELVYDGLWFSPLRNSLDAFIQESQKPVTGEVRLLLGPGRCIVNGRRSDWSLYDYGLATYDAADAFRHEDAEGFVRLWGLGLETWAARQGPGREESARQGPGRQESARQGPGRDR